MIIWHKLENLIIVKHWVIFEFLKPSYTEISSQGYDEAIIYLKLNFYICKMGIIRAYFMKWLKEFCESFISCKELYNGKVL